MRGKKVVLVAVAVFGFPACGVFHRTPTDLVSGGNVSTVVIRQPINELERETVPGTVDDLWVEPMIDTMQVPGQIDPHNIYYRPSHKTLGEIRYGRYQKVQYPDEYGHDGNNVSSPGEGRIVTPAGVEQK